MSPAEPGNRHPGHRESCPASSRVSGGARRPAEGRGRAQRRHRRARGARERGRDDTAGAVEYARTVGRGTSLGALRIHDRALILKRLAPVPGRAPRRSCCGSPAPRDRPRTT
ncbi:hypothetical protein QJS66_16585 [Kocuria rhizophila]|nr:hypothetical protein QJS66_16585 [Kocuria rhizophila]